MTWNPLALATALQTVPEQNIDVTNNESALIIKLNDYGDLQINILFTSRQMIIETFICPVSSISNPDEFNTFLLRNQKMMPLSSVGISSVQQYLLIKKSEDDAVVIGRDLQRATGRVLHCFRCVIA